MSRSDDHFALCAGKTRRRRWSANTDVSLLKGETNLATARASNITAPTQFIAAKDGRYAYRRFGGGSGLPPMCLQHFTGTLDNWDPARHRSQNDLIITLYEVPSENILFGQGEAQRAHISAEATQH